MAAKLIAAWIDKLPKLTTHQFLVVCMILSFISVSCNTPATFHRIPELKYATLIVDVVTGFAFSVEFLIKLKEQRSQKGKCKKNRKLMFDALMALFIWISVALQVVEMTESMNRLLQSFPFGLLRIPRVLILFRVLRYFNFQLESGTLTIIVVRAGHQIGGATLFLLFFLLLYGLLGVQLFGPQPYRCVMNNTDPNNVSLSDLAIPDTTCSPMDSSMCPPAFVCLKLNLTLEEKGYGAFDNIIVSIKTVYEAASQEGWVFLMYRKIDSQQDWHGYFYFFTLIFFLAWLVKNVFIAVIIETFAEIRSQLHNVWGNSGCGYPNDEPCVITTNRNSTSWKMVDVDVMEPGPRWLESWRKALRSRWFHLTTLVAIVLNVAISAFQKRVNQLPPDERRPWNFFSGAELLFTIVFDVEAVMKLICLGPRGYFKRNIYKYEAFLALITTINTVYSFPLLRSFPVLRIIRLAKLSPTLENFVYKIFGPAKKIGLLVAFTLSILTLMSSISLQMLCYVEGLDSFATFPQAFMSMFQIMTQEGWIDVMHDAMFSVGMRTFIPVSMFFILYHLFVTTVVISLFVAVILDNLELDENLKRLKQLKVSEQSVDMKQPLRLRVFERFPSKPKMVQLYKLSGDFSMPPLRESFLRQFVDHKSPLGHSVLASHVTGLPASLHNNFSLPTAIVGSTTLVTTLAILDDGVSSPPRRPNGKNESFLPTGHDVNSHRTSVTGRGRRQTRTGDANAMLADGSQGNREKSNDSPSDVDASKPTLLKVLMRDCSQQPARPASSALTTNSPDRTKSLLSAQHVVRRERRPHVRRVFADDKRPSEVNVMSSTQDPLYNGQATQEVDFKQLHLKRQQALLKRQRLEQELRENHPLFDTPLFLIKRESKFRKFCQSVVYAQYGKNENKEENDVPDASRTKALHDLLGLVPYLDWFMIMVTVASCSSMMMETTTRRVHDTPALQAAEYMFALSMACELMLKVFANGLFFTPKPTFKDLGGFLDATIFLVSIVFVLNLSSTTVHSSQFLMVLRCLRPLRIFKLVPQIRKVAIELFRGFKEIVMVGILLAVLMFVFASFGVQMYGGELAACNDWTIPRKEDCKGIFYQKIWISNSLNMDGDAPGYMVPRVWTNPRNFNFDTIGSAMLALFEVLSLKGWIEVRDILVERKGPIHALYIHLFVFLGCMMGLTLFIGVVIAIYNENKGTALLAVDQRRWEDLKSRVKIAQPLHLPPRPPGNGVRPRLYDLAENTYFKAAIAFCVMMRSFLLSIKWEEESVYAHYMLYISILFTFVFLLDVIIKMIGMTLPGMLSSWRNRYDLFITFLDIVWVLSFLSKHGAAYVYSGGWILVMLRFLSICGKHATLKMLLMTVAVSVYRSFFIIVAMFLLLLCYAFAGVVLFGTVKYGENIDRHANFATAPLAVTVLFRIVTGEDWNKIMHDCMIQPPRCTHSENYWETDCGNATAALIYFCSFYVIIAYIMLNLLVAIIVENFSLFYTMDEDILLSYSDLHMFQVTWNNVDVRRKGAVPVAEVRNVLCSLKGRLHIDEKRDKLLLKHMCYEMERIGRRSAASNRANFVNGNSADGRQNGEFYVTFHDVLMMTAYRSVDIRKSLQLEELLMREKLEAEIEEEVAKRTIREWLTKCIKLKKEKSRRGLVNDIEKPSLPNHPPIINATMHELPNVVIVPEDTDDGKGLDDFEDTAVDDSCLKRKRSSSIKQRRQGFCKSPSWFGAELPCSSRMSSLSVGNASDSERLLPLTPAQRVLRTVSLSTSLDTWWQTTDDD